MSDLSALLANALGQPSDLARDRAVAELRAGRPLLVETHADTGLCAALDGAAPSTFDMFAVLDEGVLVLSGERARTLGLPCDKSAAIPLAGLDRAAAFRLACDPRQTAPALFMNLTMRPLRP